MSTKEKEIKFISKKDLKEGEIYTITDNHYPNKILIHKYEKMSDEDRSLGSFLTDFNDKWEFRSQSTPYLTGRNISISTPEEKHWFLECEKADRFIPYDEAMGTFSKQNPFKFNIGDEIKAKPGGYYFSYPKGFAESHKKQFPSSESGILGKITERTQAQGFNWYRCGHDNWRTEEGVGLIKEDIPEYVEYIDTKYKGQIVKVEEWTNHNFCCIRFENGQREQPFKNLVKPSTKEAFDLQNKPKTISEDVFCIELNSQEELDAIMDFYKQKGFKELGDSHDYRNDYMVFIKMKDKKWQTAVCNDSNYPVKTSSELGIEVKSKSLVGRYLKALVDYPDSGSVLKGEIGIITKEYNGIPSEVDFPSQKYYGIGNITYKNRESYELMPEGFMEFVDNFYKKEEKEGMLEMLPYPKDNYFKAVVVKDIHKKDIGIKGDMPDLIPKGYQTWFISENTLWRERILSKEDVVCPENNRWRANIPAEYFQIVEDEKHNDIPKECYSSNEIIIPQVIKAQKTIQKITIESPTELDLKLKTIKPKQIQTIKI